MRLFETTLRRLLLEPYRPPDGLSESLFLELLTLVAGYLAKRLELALKRRFFTQLGGLQVLPFVDIHLLSAI